MSGAGWHTPDVLYYARMDNCTPKGNKTLKYKITAQAGFYPPMQELVGKDGCISFYLKEKLRQGANIPSMFLQAKNSLNFTGLKEFFKNDKLSGYAYGYPSDQKTYGKDAKQNPFYERRTDGYLFLVHQNENDPHDQTPTYIELIVLKNARLLVSAYCKQLVMGGFEEALKMLREQATEY